MHLFLQNYFVMKNEKKKKEVNAKKWNVPWPLETIIRRPLLTAVIRRSPLDADVEIVAERHVRGRRVTLMVPRIGIIDPHLFTKALW